MKKTVIGFLMLMNLLAWGDEGVLYESHFDKEEIGKVPADFLVLDGNFAVRREGTNQVLELPGAPVDAFSVQFGPTESSNIVVMALIKSESKGRRAPTFGVGLNGVAGYKLQVTPAKKLLELYKDQTPLASATFEWKSGKWTNLRLEVRGASAGGLKITGTAWGQGAAEPGEMITVNDKEDAVAGRASVFGSPFSGQPIQFDALRVEKSSAQ